MDRIYTKHSCYVKTAILLNIKKSVMNQLLCLAAASMSFNDIVEKLDEAIINYKKAFILEDAEKLVIYRNKVEFYSYLMLIKNQIGDDISKAFKLSNHMENIRNKFNEDDLKNLRDES